jgi:sterol desaturase/sphingolipid hydroxylase (fatty acid hydroxylase superfamily)
MIHLLTIPLAIVYGNLMEWFLHKYVLHGLGRSKKNIFSFHWHSHHKAARKNEFYDPAYEKSDVGPPLREKLSLYALVLAHIPIALYYPLFFVAISFYAIYYYRTHKKMHLNPEWGRKKYPWHWDHHMGKNQDCNWGVTCEWVDKLMKTRRPAYMDLKIRKY